jgi:uncharacterized RDD family membrane protein YckC
MSASPQPGEFERAGFVSRSAALFVDAAIVTVVLRGTAWLFAGLDRTLGRFAPPVNLHKVILAISPLLIGVYLVGFWTVLGQTPGKWLMGLKVLPLGGGRLTVKRSLTRLVGYVLAALPLYLGFLWILGPQRRGWHDRFARTEVAYTRRRPVDTTTAKDLRRRIRADVGPAPQGLPSPRPAPARGRG